MRARIHSSDAHGFGIGHAADARHRACPQSARPRRWHRPEAGPRKRPACWPTGPGVPPCLLPRSPYAWSRDRCHRSNWRSGYAMPHAIQNVFVIVQRQGAMVLGQGVLLAIRGKEIAILGTVPVIDGLLVQVSGDIRLQVEAKSLLRPDRESGCSTPGTRPQPCRPACPPASCLPGCPGPACKRRVYRDGCRGIRPAPLGPWRGTSPCANPGTPGSPPGPPRGGAATSRDCSAPRPDPASAQAHGTQQSASR